MVKLQIIETGEYIDTANANITYVKQVADLANITTANASYSWTMEIPKNPHNTTLFENLGIVGDTSSIPYRRVYVRLTESGTAIVPKGLLHIKDTGRDYNAHVQEGIIDFYKDVKVDKLGDVINTNELDHTNDVATIIGSFTGEVWRYILADYNGPPLENVPVGAAPTGDVTNLNPFALVPSVNMKWLLDQVFSHYGWKYETDTFDMEKIAEDWLTYPTALAYDSNNVTQTNDFDVIGYAIELDGWTQLYYARLVYDDTSITNDLTHLEISNSAKTTMIAKKTGTYRFELKIDRNTTFENFRYGIEINGVLQYPRGNATDVGFVTVDALLNTGDLVRVRIFDVFNITVPFGEEAFLRVGTVGLTTVDFREALVRYKVADFFKEIMIRHSLTAFADPEERIITFITMEERLTANVVDWSDKYVRRIKESYIYDDYARFNYFKHKYEEENNEYYDGIFEVNNENLPTMKVLYESKTYAPDEFMVVWQGENEGDFEVPSMKMYSIDVKVQQNNDGSETVFGSYKPLNNRFYVTKSVWTEEKIYIAGDVITAFPLASSSGCVFKDIVGELYRSTSAVLTNTRIHDIELALTRHDMLTLDLRKQYFFKQESNFYILNKLTYKSKELIVGEFVRVIPVGAEVEIVEGSTEPTRVCRNWAGKRIDCETGELLYDETIDDVGGRGSSR